MALPLHKIAFVFALGLMTQISMGSIALAAIDCSEVKVVTPSGVLPETMLAEYEVRLREIKNYESTIHTRTDFDRNEALYRGSQLDSMLQDASISNDLRSRIWIVKGRLSYRIGDQSHVSGLGAGRMSILALKYAVCQDPKNIVGAEEYANVMATFLDLSGGRALFTGWALAIDIDQLCCEAGRNYGQFAAADKSLTAKLLQRCGAR